MTLSLKKTKSKLLPVVHCGHHGNHTLESLTRRDADFYLRQVYEKRQL